MQLLLDMQLRKGWSNYVNLLSCKQNTKDKGKYKKEAYSLFWLIKTFKYIQFI